MEIATSRIQKKLHDMIDKKNMKMYSCKMVEAPGSFFSEM
jgi:hypothetical protein